MTFLLAAPSPPPLISCALLPVGGAAADYVRSLGAGLPWLTTGRPRGRPVIYLLQAAASWQPLESQVQLVYAKTKRVRSDTRAHLSRLPVLPGAFVVSPRSHSAFIQMRRLLMQPVDCKLKAGGSRSLGLPLIDLLCSLANWLAGPGGSWLSFGRAESGRLSLPPPPPPRLPLKQSDFARNQSIPSSASAD